ncbi:hypothetical protein ON010_g17227 [Phytophthora cinnamomi]|nr:hypothetical protein ON010_g17227 [Phytophthora cinnamomi]
MTANSAWVLLLLTLAHRGRYAPAEASLNESDGATATINIATVISSGSSLREQESSSSSSDQNEELNDFVLLGNTSTAGEWLDATVGYAATADSRILYETASWFVIEDGAEHEKFSTFWARFHGVNSTILSSQSICACGGVECSSWADSDAVLAAVEIENRLQGNCGENDTIALAFTSAITNTVDAYLEGEVAVNDAVAPIPLKDVDNASLSEALKSSSKYDRIFVRLAGDVCMRDTSTATTPQSSLGDTEILVLSLFTGDACAGFSSSSGSTLMPPLVPAEMGNTRDWKQDLTYIIPVGAFIFLLGCVGFGLHATAAKELPCEAEHSSSGRREKHHY